MEGHDLPRWEKDALVKAAAFADTPTTSACDPLGRPIATVARLTTSTDGRRTTRQTHTPQGWVASVADPRLDAVGAVDVATVYDLRGEALVIDSADAGRSVSLFDAVGQRIFGLDARGTVATRRFDSLHRCTAVSVRAGADVAGRRPDGAEAVVEKFRDIHGVARNMIKDSLTHLTTGTEYQDSDDLIEPMSPRYTRATSVPEVVSLGSVSSVPGFASNLPALAKLNFPSFDFK